MKKHLFWISGGFLLTAIFVFQVFWQSAPFANLKIDKPLTTAQPINSRSGLAQPSVGIDSLNSSVNRLSKDFVNLNSELSVLRTELQAIKAMLSKDSASVADSKQAIELSSAGLLARKSQLRAETLAKSQQLNARLEANFLQQTEDKPWATAAVSLIQSGLTKDNVQEANIIDIQCRVTLCRVELENDQNNNPPSLSELLMLVGEELPYMQIAQEDGNGLTSVVYFSKEALQ